MGESETSRIRAYFIVDVTGIQQPSHVLNTAILQIHTYLSSPSKARRILEAHVWYGCETSCCSFTSSTDAKWQLLSPVVSVRKGQKLNSLKFGEYSDWGMVRILFGAQNCCIARVLSRDVTQMSHIHTAMRNLPECSKVIHLWCQFCWLSV